MDCLSCEDIVALKKGSSVAYRRVRSQLKSIIYSKLAGYKDLKVFIDDLISNAFIVLIRTYDRYDSTKAKFSTYAFNRVVSASKKCYLALKYPYGGIKALAGKKKEELDSFRASNLVFIVSSEDKCLEAADNSIGDVTAYIKSMLTPTEDRTLFPKIRHLVENNPASNNKVTKEEYTEIFNLLKERM